MQVIIGWGLVANEFNEINLPSLGDLVSFRPTKSSRLSRSERLSKSFYGYLPLHQLPIRVTENLIPLEKGVFDFGEHSVFKFFVLV